MFNPMFIHFLHVSNMLWRCAIVLGASLKRQGWSCAASTSGGRPARLGLASASSYLECVAGWSTRGTAI